MKEERSIPIRYKINIEVQKMKKKDIKDAEYKEVKEKINEKGDEEYGSYIGSDNK